MSYQQSFGNHRLKVRCRQLVPSQGDAGPTKIKMGDELSQVSHTYGVCRAPENGDDDDCVEERLASQDISVSHVRVTKNWAIVKKIPWFEIQLEEAF